MTRNSLMLAWDTPASRLGHTMQTAAFHAVQWVLNILFTKVVSDPSQYVIGTEMFAVQIGDTCSGIEGLALMLSLTLGWLVYSRRELKLSRAWILVPLSLALIWTLNVLRIAALIVIGNAGFERIAVGGFHSEAGAILFSSVAVAFLLTVHRVPWLRMDGAAPAGLQSSGPVSVSAGVKTNLAAIYLVPFLAILAAGFLAHAVSDGFEWLYGLRLLAALAAFYVYRRGYRRMDWRFGWPAPIAGLLVAALWIALDHLVVSDPSGGSYRLTSIAAGLARLSDPQRITWIVLRTIAGVLTVPVAEELAFRGYLARRLQSADIEAVSFRSLNILPILGSSLAFGLLHGRLWIAGTLAGIVFALVAKLAGRLGDAVVAHATANLTIAIWVLSRGAYSLW